MRRTEEVRMLRREELDSHSRTKLMLAVRDQSIEIVKDLLDIDARQRGVIFLTDYDGRTSLFYAAERGNEEIIWTLLHSLTSIQRGALLNIKDNDGKLAEDWAQINGQEKIKRILSVERQRIEYFE